MKPLLISIFIFITAVIIYTSILFFEKPSYDRLNFIQRHVVNSIAEKWESKINNMPPEKRNIVGFSLLMNSLNIIQMNFAERIFLINPKELGFKGPKYSVAKPKNLIVVQSVKVGNRETGMQYCPLHVYRDYLRMVEQMLKDIGKRIYIDSGYRSPGRQAYLFFHYLVTSSNYSLKENARWIAMPGYSEHGDPINCAIDFTNENGINGFSDNQTAEDFEKLPEYRWLLKNAGKFNFYLSYPKKNIYGVAFEPWHWHWEETK